MTRERRIGIVGSLALHTLLLVFMAVDLPFFPSPKPLPEPTAMTVEILPTSKLPNIKNNPAPVEPKKDEKPDEEPATAKKETPETAKPKPLPPEEKPDVKKKNEKKPEPKKEEKKPEPKPEKDPLKDLFDSVKDQAKKEQGEKKKDTASTKPKAESQLPYNPEVELKGPELEIISSQLRECMEIDPGAKGIEDMVAKVQVIIHPDGTMEKAKLVGESEKRYNTDRVFKVYADRALRAVRKPECNPLKNLPPGKFTSPTETIINFRPGM